VDAFFGVAGLGVELGTAADFGEGAGVFAEVPDLVDVPDLAVELVELGDPAGFEAAACGGVHLDGAAGSDRTVELDRTAELDDRWEADPIAGGAVFCAPGAGWVTDSGRLEVGVFPAALVCVATPAWTGGAAGAGDEA